MSITIKEIDKTSVQHQQYLQVLFDEYSSGAETATSPTISNELCALPYFIGFMAFKDNEPVGFSVCFESYSTYRSMPVLNIHDFMVSKSVRGLGIGKELLSAVLLYCDRNKFLKVTLEVKDNNEVAKNLYQSLGFLDYRETFKDQLHWQIYMDS